MFSLCIRNLLSFEFLCVQNIGSLEIASTGAGCLDTGQHLMYQKGPTAAGAAVPLGNGHIENWGDSGVVDNSQHTDTSTDIDADDKIQVGLFFP